MIKCKNCGNENKSYYVICEECASEFELNAGEAESLCAEAKKCFDGGDFTEAVRIYKFLAELGVREGERELALMLEAGKLLPRDIEMATSYFYSAAKKGDILSAYKYSRLVSRLNTDAGDFWLAYSAVMGCSESYADAAMLYSRYGDEESASYYIRLCADGGEIDAIVEMARRYLYGIGVKGSENIAKWYIDKLERIPIFAIKLSRRLRVVNSAQEPGALVFTHRNRILRALIAEAKKKGLRTVLLNLAKMLSKCKAPDAAVELASLYIEGIEFPQDINMGISLLEKATESGSAVGAVYLGDLFSEGRYVGLDEERALQYYRKAVELGGDGVFEALGDVFSDGRLTAPELMLALSLYERGAAVGIRSCEKKARTIRDEREKNYLEACRIEKSSPEDAFPLLKKSVDAGYNLSHAKIGYYYECGIGTPINRAMAFYHYKTAMALGDARAIESIGRCYARGIGVAFDFKLASKYLSEAKKMGSASADRELYRIYENKKRHMMRSLYSTAIRLFYNKKFDLSRSMLEVCMSFGMPEAIYTIGCLYEFGITLPPDRITARKFYDKAAELGYEDKAQAHKQKILKMSK